MTEGVNAASCSWATGFTAPSLIRRYSAGRFFQRKHAELRIERVDAVFVLDKRRRSVTGQRMEHHQLPMRRLMDRVKAKAPGGDVDRRVELSSLSVELCKTVHRSGGDAPVMGRLPLLPIIELGDCLVPRSLA